MEWQKSSSTIVVVCNRLIFCWELPVHSFSVCLFVLEIDSLLFKIKNSCWFYFAFLFYFGNSVCLFVLFNDNFCNFFWYCHWFCFWCLFDCLFLFVNIYFLPWISFLIAFFLGGALFFFFIYIYIYIYICGLLGASVPFYHLFLLFNLLVFISFFLSIVWFGILQCYLVTTNDLHLR